MSCLSRRKARLRRRPRWWAERAGSDRGRSELPKTRGSSSFSHSSPFPPPLQKGGFRQGCAGDCLCSQSSPGNSNIIDDNDSIDNCVRFCCLAFSLRVCMYYVPAIDFRYCWPGSQELPVPSQNQLLGQLPSLPARCCWRRRARPPERHSSCSVDSGRSPADLELSMEVLGPG